ncbi:MAG TPA: AMP-binding protein [Dongiaceae bacterium]|jgi:phenylacetate-CoA ligase|nr:AMP-binding protein [Dongiaceae bacterium]
MPSRENLEAFQAQYNEIDEAYRAGMLTRKALEEWRNRQLKKVLAHVKARSPFYAQKLANIDVSGFRVEDIGRLPYTTKADLREQMHRIMSGTINEAAFFYETTGTTGAATPCPRDKKESYASNLQLRHAYQDVIEHNFPKGHRPVFAVLGPTEAHSFTDTLGAVGYELDLCVAKIWPGSPIIGFDKCLKLLRDLDVEVIATAPGQVMTLAKEARRRGLDPKRDFKVKVFMLSGEICTPELAANLESLWGARAYNSLYGSQEAFVIASATPAGKLRPHLPNYVFEIVDPATGQSLGSTGQGELVVTCLVDGVKPLVRYQTGDIVNLRDNGSSNLFDAFDIEVVGRVRDSVELNGRFFTAAQVEAALMREVRGCIGYQIVITRSGNTDTILAKLELLESEAAERKAVVQRVRNSVMDALGCECTIMVVDDLSEHVNMGGWIKWKSARLVDSRESLSLDSREAETKTETLLAQLGNR